MTERIERKATNHLQAIQQAYAPYVERIGREPAPMLGDYRGLVGRNVVHVIDDDRGSIIGLIVMWPEADHLYIDAIAVDPRSQGQRLGTRLLEHAERARCRTARASAVYERGDDREPRLLHQAGV